MLVNILLRTLITQARRMSDEQLSSNLRVSAPRAWLREHRTVTLGLPRGCGKTSALVELCHTASCLYLCHQLQPPAGLDKHVRFEALPNLTAQLLFVLGADNRLPLSYVLIDEFSYMTPAQELALFELLITALGQGWLADDFMIVRVGT